MVYDSSRVYGLPSVSVLSSSGKGTFTNADGEYSIEVTGADSIWFSYLGKPTMKFPVAKITNTNDFDISLHINITTLKEVTVRPRNYRLDSVQNRKDYAKVFGYKKPGVKVVTPQFGTGVGFDLNELINVFRFRRNKNMQSFQQRLLLEEQEKFISHRFSKALVRRLTSLDSTALDSFMLLFRPSYEFALLSSDYDFQFYIKQAHERFKKGLAPEPFIKREEQE